MMYIAGFLPLFAVVLLLVFATLTRSPGVLAPRESAPVAAERCEARELVGTVLELVQGQRYRADLVLPPLASAEVVAAGVEALGFAQVSVLGLVNGVWRVEATWGQGGVSLPRPAELVRIWAMVPDRDPPGPLPPPPAAPAVAFPAASIAGPAVVQSLDDRKAREIFREAWALERPGEELTPRKEQMVIAVARHETFYAQGWKKGSSMTDSLNWGAIHAGRPDKDGTCKPGSILYVDSSPTKSGQASYKVCFKVYESHLEGARDLIRHVYRGHVTSEVLESGDLDAFALALRQDHYFEGMCASSGPDKRPPCSVFSLEMSAAQYADVLERNATDYAKRTGQALAVGRSMTLGVVPTTGKNGEAVYGYQPPIFIGSPAASAFGGVLLLLAVAGVGLAREKGWI